MPRELKRDQPVELIIQRKGKTIYARLREDREFTAAEITGAVPFTAQFPSLDKVKKELKDLLVAGGFKIVVPVNSALAPEQAQVVVFGDMTATAPPAPQQVRSAEGGARRPLPPATTAVPDPPAVSPVAYPKPAPKPAPKASAPKPALKPAPRPAPAPAPVPAPVAPPSAPAVPRPVPESAAKSRAARGANNEDKAFKAFYDQWRARNKISRLPKEELNELRQGEWQEVKEKFMAEWRK